MAAGDGGSRASQRPAGEARLWRQARAGDRTARETLVARHLGLVRHVAARFRASGLEPEELEQVGAIGLLKAVAGFEPERGLRFSTYAVPVITGEILRYLRDNGPVRIPRSARALARRAREVRDRLRQAAGREPSLGEVAAALGVPAQELLTALEAAERPVSLEAPVDASGDDPAALLDRLAAPGSAADTGLRRALLADLLGRLDPHERRVVILRYFDDLTQQEIADQLGVSQSHVSRLLSRALARLRAWAR